MDSMSTRRICIPVFLSVLLVSFVFAPATGAESGDTVFVKEFSFSGNTVVETETLQELAAPFRNRNETFRDLKALCGKITDLYREKGFFVAQAILPGQEVQNGIVEIKILEGSVGTIGVTGNPYFHDRAVTKYFQSVKRSGVLKKEPIERSALLVNEHLNTDGKVVLSKGQSPGATDVVMDLRSKSAIESAVDVSLDYNNYGSELTSEHRFGASIDLFEPFWGSKLALRAVTGEKTDDTYFYGATYLLPLAGCGADLKLNYYKGGYAVGQELADLGLEGESAVYGAVLSYPLWKKRYYTLAFALGYHHKDWEHDMLSWTRAKDEIDIYSISANFENTDGLRGKNYVSIGFSSGKTSTDDEAAPSRLDPSDSFSRFSLRAARLQNIYKTTNLFLSASAQFSSDRLLPMEQAVLGGYGSVRGHEPSQFLGDSGYIVSGELLFAPPFLSEKTMFGKKLSELVQFSVFYDWGKVENSDTLPGEFDSEDLSGYGAGLRIYYKKFFQLGYAIAFPASKTDIDDSVYHYLSASLHFF